MQVSAVFFFCGVYRAIWCFAEIRDKLSAGSGVLCGITTVYSGFAKLQSGGDSPWRTDGVQELIVLTGVVYMFAQASTPVNHVFL